MKLFLMQHFFNFAPHSAQNRYSHGILITGKHYNLRPSSCGGGDGDGAPLGSSDFDGSLEGVLLGRALGSLDGAPLGSSDFDGSLEGVLLGRALGSLDDGAPVGSSDSDGSEEGVALGPADGKALGSLDNEGLAEGVALGSDERDGSFDGETLVDGSAEGEEDGSNEGKLLGDTEVEGSDDGELLGLPLGALDVTPQMPQYLILNCPTDDKPPTRVSTIRSLHCPASYGI